MERKSVLLRLPVEVHRLVAAYADRRGMSVNSVLCSAVADFLDRNWERPTNRVALEGVPQVPVAGEKSTVALKKRLPEPKEGRNALCPCGSGRKWKVCCR